MIFTSFEYAVFLAAVLAAYWLLGRKSWQNVMLLAASYIFYGYVHPWFCILLGISTVVDYYTALGMERFPHRKKQMLQISLISNLGMLGVFKYFNFFADNFQALFLKLGFDFPPITYSVYLPVGISFYTFQTLSYTIDVYWGNLKARRNFIDFALFVTFFPQLVAGPIERATHLLLQVETPRKWKWELLMSAWPLMIQGYLKKMVIADNMATFADKVYLLHQPSIALFLAGTIAFAIQIYMDFSGYTDIARGSARLFGFELMDNFKSPYLAISPSDFWRRWHISFSSWIRDYLYIPLGGSRAASPFHFFCILFVTMGLAGLWHGASWHFVFWGLYHGVILFIYHQLGKGGRWKPAGAIGTVAAWSVMICLTLFGWMLFRAPSMSWLGRILFDGIRLGLSDMPVAAYILVMGLLYSLPLLAMGWIDRLWTKWPVLRTAVYTICILTICVFSREAQYDFIYFQF